MKSSLCFFAFILSFFLSFVFLLNSVNGADDIIADTCKKIVDGQLTLDFCMTSLQADPNSHSADLRALDLIAVKLGKANVSYIETYIKKVMDNKEMDDYMRSTYGYCSQKFSEIQHSLDEAVSKFNSNDFSGAASSLEEISSFSDDCETKFQEAALSAPLLMKLNKIFRTLLSISVGITKLLQ